MRLPWSRRNRRKPRGEGVAWLAQVDWRAIGATLAVLAGCAALAVGLLYAVDRPVRRVVVDGPFQRVSPPEVEAVVTRTIGGGLASVDLDAVRGGIEALEWVDRAVVHRQWPDAIHVQVTEQVAAARWNEAGLLNTRGDLFIRDARYVPPELPRLEGPEGSEGNVAQLYLDAQGRLLEVGLRLSGVRLNERGAWELDLDNGLIVRLGRQAVHERLERFIRLASPLVAKRSAEIRHVDMRYTNGFSVGWNARSAVAVAPTQDAMPDG